MTEKQKPAPSEGLTELLAAYKEAYTKARQELPQLASVPPVPGVPAGQGYHQGTDEEIGQRLVERKVTTREEAEELAAETAHQDAGVPPPAQAQAAKPASEATAKP